ncbi:hypothetical protein [Sagittula stellata]|uniref:DUF1311 domain-containing protein n=1 Tax=Sagittula stellata (strain ATCC 700073 / DSM 11524 / E-37) TaxID=388399 RepID=A3KAK6_SAGS3|nr:hypothetical protein [Sagittula stellata]EBA05770.1 hypothetical protein SSE37_09448 [Sagittula stellata E-37]
MNRALPMLAVAWLALPACAEEPLTPAIDTEAVAGCVAEARARDASPDICIGPTLAGCGSLPADAPALATLCYDAARLRLSEAAAERLTRLDGTAPEPVALRARIETKYDLLSGLLQCDRLEELGRLADTPAEALALQKTRCEATASGLAYIRLLWRVTPGDQQQTLPDSPAQGD